MTHTYFSYQACLCLKSRSHFLNNIRTLQVTVPENSKSQKRHFFFSICESFMLIHGFKYWHRNCEYIVSGVDRGLKNCVQTFRESRRMIHHN